MQKVIIFFLKLLPLFQSEVDVNQVLHIFRIKFLMDNRKPVANNRSKEPNYTLWLQYLLYVFFGGIASIIIGVGDASFSAFLLAYTFFIFMLSLHMIADFSTVMLDTRDNTIILPRPVSEKTYLMARVMHISVYVLGFAVSFAIIPCITILIKFNFVAVVIFVVNTFLSAVFAIFVTHLLYLGLMKIVSGEKFKDIINYFQILVTIVLMGGYQFLIQSINTLKHLKFETPDWRMYLLPPTWMAASNNAFVTFNFNQFSVTNIALSVLIPVLGLMLVIKVLAPGFSNKLQILDQGELKDVKKETSGFRISAYLAKIFTRTSNENAMFGLIWKIAGRDRKFKQMIYPMLGSVVVFFGIMLYTQFKYMLSGENDKFYLVLLYFPLFYLFIVYSNIKFSDNYKSAWIYKIIPLDRPGEVVSATLKAISIKLFVPVYLGCNAILIYIYGVPIIIEIIAALLMNYICLCCLLLLFKFDLPFTVDNANKTNNANMLVAMVLLPVSAAISGIHYLFLYFHINFLLVIPFLGIICWFLFRKIRLTGWKKIEVFEV